MRRRISYGGLLMLFIPAMVSASSIRSDLRYTKIDTSYAMLNLDDSARVKQDPQEIKEVAKSRRKPKPEKIDEPRGIRPATLRPVAPGPQNMPGTERMPQGGRNPDPRNPDPGNSRPGTRPENQSPPPGGGGGRRGG